ncbi:alpha-1,4-N-acetylglucosaminyltransferase-like [Hyperolius riggenbachi]|uniref:alpha-1,4-N-acetylglucosaminyltransferase-like n=1 Tax=Hyperolius riggenbachi TaxID=752182 RepID=UPI0035A351C5
MQYKIMLKRLRKLLIIVVIAAVCLLIWDYVNVRQKDQRIINNLTAEGPASCRSNNETCKSITPFTILSKGNGILFMETTERMEPPSLVSCSIESAARVYPHRPVVYFMKGLGDVSTEEDLNRTRKHFPILSSFDNVYFFPLRMTELFMYTPLITWYQKVNPKKEKYWTHVISDACRFAMMWKYGGIYMDTDVISLRPVTKDCFLAAESFRTISSSVFALPAFHSMTWNLMDNFVVDYKGWIWGHQGPGVFTRVFRKLCGDLAFISATDIKCSNVSYLYPDRFYPILYTNWEKYYEVWKPPPAFSNSFGLHLWNYKNKNGQTMIPGSNTLVEHLYKNNCPSTYEAIVRKEKTYL